MTWSLNGCHAIQRAHNLWEKRGLSSALLSLKWWAQRLFPSLQRVQYARLLTEKKKKRVAACETENQGPMENKRARGHTRRALLCNNDYIMAHMSAGITRGNACVRLPERERKANRQSWKKKFKKLVSELEVVFGFFFFCGLKKDDRECKEFIIDRVGSDTTLMSLAYTL